MQSWDPQAPSSTPPHPTQKLSTLPYKALQPKVPQQPETQPPAGGDVSKYINLRGHSMQT